MSTEAYIPAQDPSLIKLLQGAGIASPEQCINSWAYLDTYFDENQQQQFRKVHNVDANVDAIDGLEAARPGATKLLNDTYLVRHFGRYPLDMLIDQFDLHDIPRERYGVVLSGAQDWCGSFTRKSDNRVPFQLFDKTPTTHALRVCEAKDAQEAGIVLSRMDRLFGKNQKIGFMAVQAHGSQDGLQLSVGNQDLEASKIGEQLAACRGAFEYLAPIALISCSTENIGQALSAHFRAQVIAPTSATTVLAEVDIHADEYGGLHIIPDYHIPIEDVEIKVRPALFIDGKAASPEERLAYIGPEPARYSEITGI